MLHLGMNCQFLCVVASKDSKHSWRNQMYNTSQFNWATEKRCSQASTENHKCHEEMISRGVSIIHKFRSVYYSWRCFLYWILLHWSLRTNKTHKFWVPWKHMVLLFYHEHTQFFSKSRIVASLSPGGNPHHRLNYSATFPGDLWSVCTLELENLWSKNALQICGPEAV